MAEGSTLPAAYTGPDVDPNDYDGAGPAAGSSVTTSGATVNGTNSGDTIGTSSGHEIIYGHGGNDSINSGSGDDTVYGQAGNYTITVGNGADLVYGGSRNDYIGGDAGVDVIYGGSGNDTILGGTQNDISIGGYGADSLIGGNQDDTFKFLDLKDTNDTITDFKTNGIDHLDFIAIDANSALERKQAFAGVHNDTNLHANSVSWYYDSGANTTVVLADTDGNIGTAEFMVTLTGNVSLVSADFVV